MFLLKTPDMFTNLPSARTALLKIDQINQIKMLLAPLLRQQISGRFVNCRLHINQLSLCQSSLLPLFLLKFCYRGKVHTNMCEPKVCSANRKLIFGFIFGSAIADGERSHWGRSRRFNGSAAALETRSDKVALARKNVFFTGFPVFKAARGGTDNKRGSSRTVLHEGE